MGYNQRGEQRYAAATATTTARAYGAAAAAAEVFRYRATRCHRGAATARVNWSEVAGSGANGSAPGAPVVMVTRGVVDSRPRWRGERRAATNTTTTTTTAAATDSSSTVAPLVVVYARRRRRRRAPVYPAVGSTNLTRWPAGQFTPIWDRGRQVSERSKHPPKRARSSSSILTRARARSYTYSVVS